MGIDKRTEGGQAIYTVTAEGLPIGCVVVDSSVASSSRGGLRMMPDIEEEEIRAAARTMTLKYGFCGLAQGGAKAGVSGNPDAPPEARFETLVRFAREIRPLLIERIYLPHGDMGTNNDEIREMVSAVGLSPQRREWRVEAPGEYTARSVFAATREAVAWRGLRLRECTVAIEGFGSVGRPLARLLDRAGATLVAMSTSRGAIHDPEGLDVARLLDLAERHGSRAVEEYGEKVLDRRELLTLPADVLCPCARHHSIHQGNAQAVAAAVVCPGANDPVTPEAEAVLARRGIVSVPDFVANAGGVLAGTMQFAAVPRRRIEALIDEEIGSRVRWLLDQAVHRGTLPRTLAEEAARRRFAEVRRAAEQTTTSARLFRLAVACHRRGWLPAPLIGALAPAYFRRGLALQPSNHQ